MTPKTTLLKILILLSITIGSNAYADWQLNNDQSTLSFVSIKKGKIAEVNTFEKLKGKISKQGNITLDIDLSSVNTRIDIRDTRMKEHLFQIKQFPKATLSASIDLAPFKKLAVGETSKTSLDFKLNLHGFTKPLTAIVIVTKLKSGLQVSSATPVIVDAGDFELIAGIAKLQEIAGLPSIDTVVPVSVNLQFDKN